MKSRLNKTAMLIFLELQRMSKKEKDVYVKIDNAAGAFMPLYVEKINETKDFEFYSLAHYGEQNGDLMADPEMCFLVSKDTTKEVRVIPYYFRNDYAGKEKNAITFENSAIKAIDKAQVADNVEFANMWLKNIQSQQGIRI